MLHSFFQYLLKNQVIFALFLIAFGWVVIQVRDIIVSLFLSYIIMSAIIPLVNYLRAKGVPQILAVLIPYLGMIFAIFLLIIPLIPFVYEQIQILIARLPILLNDSAQSIGIQIEAKKIDDYINSEFDTIGQSAVNVTQTLFGGFFSVITVFVVSFYLLMYHESFKAFVSKLFKREHKNAVLTSFDKINHKLGAWLRGQTVLCFFIGFFSWIGLTILGMPYALPLALIAGILEVVPTLGPILAAVPAVIVALTISPPIALAVVALYILIQALENQLLVPKVMEKAVGLNPVIVILGVMIGAKLMGVAGALLAIPFISFILVLYKSVKEEISKRQ